ncbi:hypothetical protein EBB79_13265 [Parasedimentitalea marina]|uniref:Uncharacterized protein n=1 Tax=Parasedimentitalea marina TaxID=2483033 RepID=A0A3T0N3Y6_9RHOB|nr:hypothetical protein [Parasedimentitalea marina]AZV78746.1 hypothetical protein EBB79_13265 [Parasedimentitalea marina]
MPKSKEKYRLKLRQNLSAYATSQTRASMTLGGRLTVLRLQATVAGLTDVDLADITAEETARSDRRLARITALHPVGPVVHVEDIQS